MELTEKQTEAVKGVRELADHLEANPELIDLIGHQKLYMFFYMKDGVESGPEYARCAMLLKPFTKSSDAVFFNVSREFGPMFTLQLTARHELICEKVVISTEEAEVEERDEALVAEALASIPTTTVTKTIEHTEWKCPSILEMVQQ